jgi:hypothetical protein
MMNAAREKAQGLTKRIIGEMIGDQLLVEEAKEQLQHADDQGEKAPPTAPSQSPPADRQGHE